MPEQETRRRGRIEPLGGGRFKVTVYVGRAPDGKRLYHRKTLRNSTPSKAQTYAARISAQADAGDYFTAPKVTLGFALEESRERGRRAGVRQTTLEHWERFARVHLIPAFGEQTPLTKLTADGLQTFYDRLLDGGYKSSSVLAIHAYLKGVLARAVKLGRLRVSPADLVELPARNKPKKARVFDAEEAERFVEAAWRTRRYVIFVFALLTGLRPSEFFGIEYPDLALEEVTGGERGVVRITKAVVWSGGRWYFNEPKTAAGRRTVYFPAVIYHELMAGRAAHLESLRRLGQTHELLFTNTMGRPLNRANLTRRFFAACRGAGLSIEGRSLYTLRRSHATLSLLTGDNLKALSERMGHVSVEFTQDEYVDTLPVMQQQAATRLESRLLRTQLAPSDGERAM